MVDHEHLENTTQPTGDANASFDVYLPFSESGDEAGATHVAHMYGDESAFLEVLAGFVATGSDLSAPLRGPVADDDLEAVRLALDGLGPARVDSIEARR